MRRSGYRRLALEMGVVAVVAFLGVPRAAGGDLVLRTGTFAGQWHTNTAQFTIDKVNADGSFSGNTKLLDGTYKGWVITFTGKLERDNALTLTRTDKVDAKGAPAVNGTTVQQVSTAASPQLIDRAYVWKGVTKGPGPGDKVFELRLPDVGVARARRWQGKNEAQLNQSWFSTNGDGRGWSGYFGITKLEITSSVEIASEPSKTLLWATATVGGRKYKIIIYDKDGNGGLEGPAVVESLEPVSVVVQLGAWVAPKKP